MEALVDIIDTLPPGQYAIYALIDPTDEKVYYVGQTRNPHRRLEQHLAARHHRGKKGEWLRQLNQKGQQPLMKILEIVAGEKAALAKEQEWIRHFLEGEMPLLNHEAQPRQKHAGRPPTPVAEVRLIQTSISGAPPIVVVKLLDGRIGATLRSLCLALSLSLSSQLHRLYRQPIFAASLVTVIVKTEGGLQKVDVLLASAIPLWAGSLQKGHLDSKKYANVLTIQQEFVPALYRAFSDAPPPAEEKIASESIPQDDLTAKLVARLAATEGALHDLTSRVAANERLLEATIKRLLWLQTYAMQVDIAQRPKPTGRRRGDSDKQ